VVVPVEVSVAEDDCYGHDGEDAYGHDILQLGRDIGNLFRPGR